MTTNPISSNRVEYSGGGSGPFSVPFDKLDKAYVHVYVDGQPVTFTWLDDFRVTLAQAAPSNSLVLIMRVTPSASPLVEWEEGAILSAKGLNRNNRQALDVSEEAAAEAKAALRPGLDGTYNVGDRRISSLKDPENTQDAANKRWVESFTASSVSAAEAAVAAAEGKVTEAAAKVTEAAVEKTAAEGFKNDAEGLKDQTSVLKDQAVTARDEAETFKTQAEAAKVAAEASQPITITDKGRELVAKATEAEMRTVLGAASDATVQSVVNALAEKATTVALNNLQTQVDNFSGSPIGSILTWAFEAPPADYLELNGAVLNRADYPLLFSAVSGAGMLQTEGSKQHTQWGNGDGSTTFSLPDWRGEHLIGWDHGRGVDAGRGLLSWQADEVKSHTHSGSSLIVRTRLMSGSAHVNTSNYGVNAHLSPGYTSQTIQDHVSGNVGHTGAATNRVRTVAVMFLVKFR